LITNSGKHIQISERRYCGKCQAIELQVCHKVRCRENTEQAGTLIKMSYWICPSCLTETEDVKVQPLPTDKVRIINRLLKMQEDYAIASMTIASQPERLLIEITVRE
jgi:hypothetical protein